MNVIFMGTPEFAVASLKELVKKHNVTLVVTQPDKPKGRGKRTLPPPVKVFAESRGIEVYQPKSIKSRAAIDYISKFPADVITVVAYGKLIGTELLEYPKKGCINVHGSLLPKYRGAAPIQWALINGETYTGITTMYMVEQMDAGDMILKERVVIDGSDTYESLSTALADIGAEKLIETLHLIEENKVSRIKQDRFEVTYAPIIKKEMGIIDWSMNRKAIRNLIRGLIPWPTAYTYYNGNMLKIWGAEILYEPNDDELTERLSNSDYGTIVDVIKDKGLLVKTGDGVLLVTEIQKVGGKRMAVPDFLRGHQISIGTVFTKI